MHLSVLGVSVSTCNISEWTCSCAHILKHVHSLPFSSLQTIKSVFVQLHFEKTPVIRKNLVLIGIKSEYVLDYFKPNRMNSNHLYIYFTALEQWLQEIKKYPQSSCECQSCNSVTMVTILATTGRYGILLLGIFLICVLKSSAVDPSKF